MSAELTITPLGRRHKRAFVALMCRAFVDDPIFLHLYPGDRGARERAMRPFLSFMFDATGWRGDMLLGLFRDGGLVACALVDRPHAGAVRAAMGQALTMARFLPLIFGLGIGKTGFLTRYMDETRKAAPAAAHHYLAMIGVDPAAQGQGFGRRMIAGLADLAGRHPGSAGIALDTENEANIPFYRGQGFDLRAWVDIGPCQAASLFRPREDMT